MADEEHIQLSSYIKNTHQNLRQNAKKIGFDKAWQEHCQNNTILQEYALSMKKLATEYWDKNVENNSKVISRITWTYDNISQYFDEGLLKQRNRELEIINKLTESPSNVAYTNLKNFEHLNVLDVGSCYNPFSIYKNLNVTPIDIAPSCENVYSCDFVNVKISSDTIFNNNNITNLKENSFNIVIFSLFLEYLPSPNVRLECCKKAYKLLDYEGLLIIITPDSKHVGANARYMKSWRFTLSHIGFSRIKYEKLPYLHCMLFRKAICIDVTQRWTKMHESEGLDNKICIPQDFYDN